MLRSLAVLTSLMGAVAPALALATHDLPRRKSGLWSMSIIPPGTSVPMTMQQCVDEKSDDMTASMADKTK